jgi:UDP-N-acetylmuramate--alanine ligase
MVVGGKVNGFRTNARLGRGEFLVAEADESDRSFIKLSPTIAVITNIDPEHMENYRDFDHVREAYTSFANKVPFYGVVVACVSHPVVRGLLPKFERRVVTYGLNEGNWTAADIRQRHGVLTFTAVFNGRKEGDIRLEMPGRHNVLNALASIAAARELDIPFKTVQKGLARFKGIERRFHILKKEPMIVTDYAHHPKEIEAVLGAARENWPERRVFCVVQPHRFTRLASLFNEFVGVLSGPPALVVMPVYPAGEAPIEGATSERLFEELKRKRNGASFTALVKDKKEMFETVKRNTSPDDIILFLGAGDVWKMGKEYVKRG